VDSGSVSLAPAPLPAPTPFRFAPSPRTPSGWGQTKTLSSLLEGSVGDVHPTVTGRGGLFPTLHVPATHHIPDGTLLDPIARPSQRQSDRHRGGCPSGEGGHRGGALVSTVSRVYQQSLLGAEEEREDAPSHQPQEAECSASGHSALQDGDSLGRPPNHPSGRLGSLHRSEGCVLPRPHRTRRPEVLALRLERTPIPVLRPPLRPVTRWVPRSVVAGLAVVWAGGGGGGFAILRMRLLLALFSLVFLLILEFTSF
jgi:hypothetical protein